MNNKNAEFLNDLSRLLVSFNKACESSNKQNQLDCVAEHVKKFTEFCQKYQPVDEDEDEDDEE